jgi:phage/plasmid-associated DNA primase
MVDPQDIKTLIQIPAQALLQMQTNHAFKKAYLLQGEPHAGKTSYLKFLYEIFGSDFRGSISLQQLCDDKFVGGALEGKLLNIYDDLEDVALSVIDHFKNLTGDCNHSIERKYQSRYTGKITAVHIFTCNYPPGFPDTVKRDAAFWTRWEYLKFPFTYPVNPNFYVEWYTQERKSSFFNLIIAAMIHIRKYGLLSNSDIQGVMTNWNINSEPLYQFIADTLDVNRSPGQTYHLSKQKLYMAYISWCNENDIPEHKRKQTMVAFTIALQAQGIVPSQKKENKKTYETYSTTQFTRKTGSNIDLNYITTLDF